MTTLNLSAMASGESLSSLMSLSTLLMNRTGFTLSLRACLTTVSVWGMHPSTASATTTTPSTALMALVTSPPKSTWPGVSIRLMRKSFPFQSWTMDTLAENMVMPLSCSCLSKSVNSCWPASSSLIMPAPATRLSVRVVLPWSM